MDQGGRFLTQMARGRFSIVEFIMAGPPMDREGPPIRRGDLEGDLDDPRTEADLLLLEPLLLLLLLLLLRLLPLEFGDSDPDLLVASRLFKLVGTIRVLLTLETLGWGGEEGPVLLTDCNFSSV